MKVAGAVLAGALLLAGPASAQMDSREAITLQNEILDLRQQLQSMPRGGGPAYPSRGPSGGGADSGLVSQLLDRVSTLEEQVRQLRGRVDELGNQQQQQAADFNKQIGDLNFALQNGGGRGSSAPPGQNAPSSLLGVPAAVPPPAASAGPPPRTP